MTKQVPLTQGKFAIVDDEDFERVSKLKWHLTISSSHHLYARSESQRPNRKPIRMHRFIMNCPEDLQVDHINGDGLDNRRSNLRVCTRLQNSYNLRKPIDNESGYKGVTWDKRKRKWQARIVFNNRDLHLGRFSDPIDAARAYDKKAVELFGEFANINFTK